MANISPLTALDQRQDFQVMDQSLLGSDWRIRLQKYKKNKE
jgi:diaminohydroxyphosphoribosylaminopyrimidine deaminase/5-amino-6-(5-phosphoribosylamino)uracil reductase